MRKTEVVDFLFYSQFGEDKILYEIFRHKDKGLCIEVGANDGVNDSTTMFFEKIGWDCILIEPNPELCKYIRKVRNGLLHECAVSDQAGYTTLYVAEGAERSHGVSTICDDQKAQDRIRDFGFTVKPLEVRVMTLDVILDASNIHSSIDFLSLDVEGHELNVLKGFSLGKWNPRVILVEDNSNNKDQSVTDYLSDFGYVLFMRTGVNNWYAHENNEALVNWKSKSLHNKIIYNRTIFMNKWSALKNKVKKIISKMIRPLLPKLS